MGLVGVGVHRMIQTCTRRPYHANYSQQLLNSATTMHSLNLWTQRCMGFCKRHKSSLLFGAFATWVTLSYVRIQIVPYTRQIQLVSNEKEEEKRAEFRWKMLMEDCKGNDCLLPLSDPRSIRVQSIAANMIRALNVGLRLKKECKVNGHSCEINGNFRDYMKPNQMWDHKLLWKPSTKHLDNGKDWEVYVLNCIEKEVALVQSGHVCHFNKRIVISRGLLEGLKSDAELAALIGHQVCFFRFYCKIQLRPLRFMPPNLVPKSVTFFFLLFLTYIRTKLKLTCVHIFFFFLFIFRISRFKLIYLFLLDWAYCWPSYSKNLCKVSLESLSFQPYIL